MSSRFSSSLETKIAIHYNPKQDGRSSEQLRRSLPKFLREKKISVDNVFITGDYRHALHQKDDDANASNSATFILEISDWNWWDYYGIKSVF